mmetsp:Transcript_18986/g.62055  ORF Transcript_18986/g.62055 Transcript_18986/m.62055 type:complete len:216 (-) Transcript_18986:361-1008(-)
MNGGRRVNKSSSRCATICLVEMSRSSTPCPASSRDSSRPTSFRSGCPASSVSSAAASRPWSLASFSEIASLSACPSRGKEPVRSTRGFSSLSTACVGARSAAISPASAPERSLTAPASSTIVSADMSSGGRSARASFVSTSCLCSLSRALASSSTCCRYETSESFCCCSFRISPVTRLTELLAESGPSADGSKVKEVACSSWSNSDFHQFDSQAK